MSCTLERTDRQRLKSLERTIQAGIATFHKVGSALAEIRDGRLYRATHPSFGAYCQDRWGFSKQHGLRLIDAADVADDLAPVGAVANEAQARELVPLDREQRLRVFDEATDGGSQATTAARLAELRKKAMASLTPDEQQEVISGCEAQVLASQKSAAQTGGEGRRERLAAVDRALRKALKLAGGLGDEAGEGIDQIEQARAWFASLPAACGEAA